MNKSTAGRRLTMGLMLTFVASRALATWYGGGSFDGYDEAVGGGVANQPQISNAIGATNVTDSGAWLTGMLLHTGSAPARVMIYWGNTDGTTDSSAWEHHHDFGSVAPFALLNHFIALDPGQTYYYRVYATNTAGESAWAYPASECFVSPAPPVIGNGNGIVYGRSSAVMNGMLVAGLSADITIFWGTEPNAWSSTNSMGRRTVGGTDFSPNPFHLLVDDLSPETTYAYVVRAENEYGIDETDVVWFTTRTNDFITTKEAAWFGGGLYDGYDDEVVESLMPGSGGTLLLLR